MTANEWRGPASGKPVKQIRQVSYDTYADDPNDEHAVPAESLLAPYSERADQYPERVEQLPILNGQLKELPRDYAPWWNAVINRPMRQSQDTLSVNVETLVLQAVEHSPQITAMRIDPRIRETVIVEEDAAFDWTTFAETKYNRSNDPVGNKLTVGGTGTRYVDDTVYAKGGVKKRFNQGAQFDIAQRVGHQDNNSTFFSPNPQGTARLELNLTQPLMRGAGSMVNESRTVLAFLDRDISEEELSAGLQDHLLAVYQAYWSLYRSRSVKLQQQRLLDRAEHIWEWLVGRQGLDTKKSQVLRAQAAVASRRSEIVRAEMAIRNAESQLRLLVNSPNLKEKNQLELLPAELPLSSYVDVSLRGSLETALKHRPDVSEAIQRMKATSLRLGVAKNDLLPKLDIVLGTYAAGLQKADVGGAYSNQYTTGGPGYTIGLTFEYPLGNRAAKARHERREWEMAKALKEFEAAVETGMTEVELAAREHETSFQEMLSRFQSMLAAEADASNLEQRFTDASGNPDVVVGILLEDMLEAQARVTAEEAEFVESQVNYVLAIVKLKKATGVLLSCECGPVGTMPIPAKQSADADEIQIPELPVPEPVASKK